MSTIQKSAINSLSAMPFNALIGGPMSAAIDAQVTSARASADFIQRVAFHPDTGEARHVVFVFEQSGRKNKIEVPLLAIVPVPFLRIEELNIDFKASVTSETSTHDTATGTQESTAGVNGSGSAGWGPLSAGVEMSAGYSSKKDSSSTRESRYSVEYTIDISCRAVQDDMPAGLAHVLALLRENTRSEALGTIEVAAGAALELSLPAPGQGDPGTSLDIPFMVRNADGATLGGVMVEFACADPDIVVTIPRARTGSDGKVTTQIKYAGAGVTGSAKNLAAGAALGSFRVGARASAAVGSAEIDIKVAQPVIAPDPLSPRDPALRPPAAQTRE